MADRSRQRLQYPRFGAVSAGADRRVARRQIGARDFRPATIRSNSPAPRSICRRGAPAGWRATCSSTRMKDDGAILPRIVAIGDLDEDEIAFAQAATGDLAEPALALPEAIAPLERRLLLAELILKWANSPAVRGARRLAVDRQHAAGRARPRRRSRPPDGRHDDAPGRLGKTRRPGAGRSRSILADVAALSQDCARILAGAPQGAAARSKPASRRDLLIEAEAKRLANSNAPVIAAGSTGSMPATAKLARDHRAICRTAPWCCPASTWISTTPRGR